MRRVIEYCLVSADGIVLDDPFPFKDYLDDAYLRERVGVFEACDALLCGRTTYTRFARAWAANPTGHRYIARLAGMRKYVFSSKLEQADWPNSTIVRGDAVAEVTRLKQQDGDDLLVIGHGVLGETLLRERLLDVLELAVYPVMLGQGKPLLRQGQAATMRLASSKSFSKLVKLSYDLQY